MSLALVQDYSSEEERVGLLITDSDDSDTEPEASLQQTIEPVVQEKEVSASLLPSPADVFAEVTGPPEYLKFAVTGPIPSRTSSRNHSQAADYSAPPQLSNQQERKVSTSGAVTESKPVLLQADTKQRSGLAETPSKVLGAALPPPEDAALLLRMCLRCGVPKTFSHAGGMVCPTCHDKPAADADADGTDKKKRSVIKDKEKSKRMRGQSSHATWKSETEMHLRQQFD